MKFLVCSLLSLLLWIPVSLAQQLSGVVVSAETGTPLTGVEVYVLPEGLQVFTDALGVFSLTLPPGEGQELVAFLPGYQLYRQSVNLDSITQIRIELEAQGYETSEVVLTAQRKELFSLRRLQDVEGTAIYAGKKNEVVVMDLLTANIPANNPRQIYAQVAGLNIFETNDAGLQLNIGGRGLDPNRSAHFNIRQNGYDISADALGYPESYYTPPAEALKEIQIIRGAASLQYGPQFGGLVNFRFRDPIPDRAVEWVSRQSIGSFGLLTSFNSLSGTLGKVSYYGYVQGKIGAGFRPNSGFQALNTFGKVRYQLSPRTSLEGEVTYLRYLAQQPGGLTDAQFYRDPTFSNRERNWFEVDWRMLAWRLRHSWDKDTRLSLLLYGLDAGRKAVGFRSFRVSQIDDPDSPRDLIVGDFHNAGFEARFLKAYQLGNQKAVALIGTKLYLAENTSIQGAGTTAADADFTLANDLFPTYPNQSDFTFPNRNAAVFGEHIFPLGRQLTITPGIRFEYIDTRSMGSYKKIDFDLAGNSIRDTTFTDNRQFERKFLLLGVGMSYKPVRDGEFYANFSQNYRSVTFADIRLVNPSFQIDPNISDETGFTADLGFRGKFKDWLSFDLGGFALLYDNRLGEVLRAEVRETASGDLVETGRVIRFRGNIGSALMTGFESLVDVNVRKWAFPKAHQWQADFFVNLGLTTSRYLNSEIPGVSGSAVEFVPFINAKTGVNLGYKDLVLSTQFTHLSEQFTDATNAPQLVTDNQSGIRGAIPAYQIVDLSGSYTWKWLKLEAGVNNLLNSWYFTRRATGYPGPGILPSAPRSGYIALAFKLSSKPKQ